ERMKGGREHCIPLSDAALDVLREAMAGRTMLPESLVFPSPVHERTPLSDTSLTMLLRWQAWTDNDGRTITAHGFRSSFRDWAGESTHHQSEVIEHALAHGLPNKAEAAYARGTLLQKRAALMADWGAFCCPAHGGRPAPCPGPLQLTGVDRGNRFHTAHRPIMPGNSRQKDRSRGAFCPFGDTGRRDRSTARSQSRTAAFGWTLDLHLGREIGFKGW